MLRLRAFNVLLDRISGRLVTPSKTQYFRVLLRQYSNKSDSDKDEEIRHLRAALREKQQELTALPEVLAAKREEREWQREESRRRTSEEEAKAKSEDRRREEAEARRKLEELKYKIPMAWIGFIMTFVPLIWTLRGEQDRYEKMMAKREYQAARTADAQDLSMWDSFSRLPFGVPPPDQWCERVDDEKYLRDSLLKQIGQLVILEGPSGSGKSSLLKKILAENAASHSLLVVHYDLRPRTPPNPDHFLHGFLTAVGYVIDPPGTDDFVQNKEKGLDQLTNVLQSAASKGRKPIIFLDNLDSIQDLIQHPEGATKIVLNKLLEMVNSDLLNVVMTANIATSKLQLDDVVAGWRSRRTLYYLSSWGPLDSVVRYIDRLNQKEHKKSRWINNQDAELLHRYVGVNVNDLNSIITQHKATGTPIREIINSRIVEEDHRITGLLGALHDVHSEEEHTEMKALGHYLRLWTLMEKLTESDMANGRVGEKELATFPADEIEWCMQNNLITIERSSGELGQSDGYTVTAEKPLVMHGMRQYMNSHIVQTRKEEFCARYAAAKKDELYRKLSTLVITTGVKSIDQLEQLSHYQELIDEYSALQAKSRRKLKDLRKEFDLSNLDLQNER